MTAIDQARAREQFLERRRTGIGGSDVAAILGLSKYRTVIDVYVDKRQLAEDDDSPRLEMGRYLEEPILHWYVDEKRCGVRSRSRFIRHPEHDFLVGNLDLEAENEHKESWIVDAKNVHFRALSEWGGEGSDEIPLDALFQAHHYLFLCPEAQRVDFAVLRGGAWPPRVHIVLRDAEFYALVLPQLEKFWWHVRNGVPPAADFADEKTLAGIKALFQPRPEKEPEVEISPVVLIGNHSIPVDELAEAYELLKGLGKELEGRTRRVEAVLRAALGDHRSGRVGEIVIDRIFNKGGFREAYEVKPYDFLKIRLPKNYERRVTQARIGALLGEGQ